MATVAVPVTVAEDALQRIAGLSLSQQFEAMLEHTRRTVPGLLAINVTLEYDPHPGVDPAVVIWAHREDPGTEDDTTDREWGAWKIATYPPHVCQHFVMLTVYETPNHGR